MEMKKIDFESPVIVDLKDMAEVVYADVSGTSGSAGGNDTPILISNCWELKGVSRVQAWNGSYTVYEVSLQHLATAGHNSSAVTVSLDFSGAMSAGETLEEVVPEQRVNYTVSVNSPYVSITREHHANGMGSCDNVTFKVFARTTNTSQERPMGDTVSGWIAGCTTK